MNICKTNVKFLCDSGAPVDLIDEQTFNSLKTKQTLKKYTTILYPYGKNNPIQTLGELSTRVLYKEQYRNVTFIVTKGSHGNVLSYSSCVLLGIFNAINKIEFDKIRHHERLKEFIQVAPKVFEDRVGNMKDKVVKLTEIDGVEPIKQPLRPIPIHQQEPVSNENVDMINNRVIEPVPGPVKWISPIVVVPKANGKIRICLDAKMVNKAKDRERHQSPTIDNIRTALNGAKYFSKIDL